MEYENSMTYTNNTEQIVFLKDADIVNNMSGLTISSNSILSNGIPSYDLFRKYYNETSANISVLSGNVSDLSDFTKKAVVYNATLLSTETETNKRLSSYLFDNFHDASYKFKQGYMYHLSVSHMLSDATGISNFIGANDYIIFNKDAVLSDVKFADIDLIRDSMTETLSIASILSAEISSNDKDIEYLSSQISSNDNDISVLSGNVSTLSNFTKTAVVYNTTLLKSDTITNQRLSSYLFDNFHDASYKFKHGYMYRLSAGYELSDANHVGKFLGENDYIIFNKDKILSNVLFEDIDIIRDSYNETISAVSVLSAEISSNDKDIEYLSSLISSNDGDIEYLSSAISSKIWIKDPESTDFSDGKHSDLSIIKIPIAEYKEKSISSTLVDNTLYVISSDYIEAFGQVISNMVMTDDPVESEAASKHYVDTLRSNATLSASNLCAEVLSIDTRYTNTFTDKDRTADSHISSDNLILTDFNEHISPTVDTHKQYYATFESGTIVLKPLNF